MLGAPRARFRKPGLDIASILNLDPGAGELSVQPRISDRHGPMSTPRRPAPRSRAAPMIATRVGGTDEPYSPAG